MLFRSSYTLIVNEVNVTPVLTLPADTNANELTLYTASATATDADLPSNSLTFALVSGPAGLTVAANGDLAWTPTEAQGPSTNVVTLRVTDNGVPPASDTKTLAVQVLPALRAGLRQAGSQVTLTFPTVAGRMYRVEFKNTLDAPAWTPLGSDILATGMSLSFSDDLGGSAARFYRVVQGN